LIPDLIPDLILDLIPDLIHNSVSYTIPFTSIPDYIHIKINVNRVSYFTHKKARELIPG